MSEPRRFRVKLKADRTTRWVTVKADDRNQAKEKALWWADFPGQNLPAFKGRSWTAVKALEFRDA